MDKQKVSRRLVDVAAGTLLIGLLFSKFLMSLSMGILLLAAIINYKEGNIWRNFIQKKAYPATTLIFFIILVSGLYTDNIGKWGEQLRIALPFLLLPIAFAGLPPPATRQYTGVMWGFVPLIGIVSYRVVSN